MVREAHHFVHEALFVIVPSGSCVRTRRSQAALMAKFVKFKRRSRLNFANFAMRAAWLRAISHTTAARHYVCSVDFLVVLFKKPIKTAVPGDDRPPGALVLTKLNESSRFEVGHIFPPTA